MNTQNIKDHINTHEASLVLKYVYNNDVVEMTKQINALRDSLGHTTVTENTVRRYCNAGKGYEGGPPVWFAAVVQMLLIARLR